MAFVNAVDTLTTDYTIASYTGNNSQTIYVIPLLSDGRAWVRDAAGNVIENRPNNGEYTVCGDDHSTATMWKRKLAVDRAMTNVDRSHRGTPHELLKFPANYFLYEKAGPFGRKDYYLYGYPILGKGGKIQFFRSPEEFKHHFQWACGFDNTQCNCKFCWQQEINTHRYPNVDGADETIEDDYVATWRWERREAEDGIAGVARWTKKS